MVYQLGALVTCAAALVYTLLRRYRRPSTIRDVPGPVNPSWIFGTSRSSCPLLTFSWRSIVVNVTNFKDTSGTYCSKKPEGQRGGSLRNSGTSFAGTALLGYASPCIVQMPVTRCRRVDSSGWRMRTGGSLVDRGPEGNQSYPPEIWLSLREAERPSGTGSVVDRSQYRIGRG